MNVVILTQDDPFYLGKSIQYLLGKMPDHINVQACVVFDVSPFGKRESFIKKLLRTWNTFGLRFTLKYSLEFVKNKLHSSTKVKHVLKKNGIPIINLEKGINHESSLRIIKSKSPDVLVSIAGNQIFKKPLINLAPKGCINLHTALLPKYRGLMPSFWVLKNNEKETGVSVFFVDEGIDSGPIIVQKRIEIGQMTQKELIEHSKIIGMDAIIEALTLIAKDSITLIPNPKEEMTYYSFPTKKDVREFRAAGKRFFK